MSFRYVRAGGDSSLMINSHSQADRLGSDLLALHVVTRLLLALEQADGAHVARLR